jgi:hypothetical protein
MRVGGGSDLRIQLMVGYVDGSEMLATNACHSRPLDTPRS